MGSKTWIYIIILIIVLAAGGVFFWWMYKTSRISPKAEVTPTPPTQTFTDVTPSYWAFNQIEAVNKAGYMVGYHEFKPDQDATRADVAAAIAKAYSKSFDNPTPSFTDVPKTHWAYKEIEGLKQAGWLDGYGDGTFKPDQAATRADLAIFIAGAAAGGKANVPDGPAKPSFSDVSTSNPAYKYIEYCQAHDLLSGYSGGTFKPDQNATRADVATAVARAKAGGDAAVPTPTTGTQSFTDVLETYWAFKYIEYVKSIGAMIGYPPTFKPDDFADRATIAVAIARAFAGGDANVPVGPLDSPFSDLHQTHWAYKYIAYLVSQTPPIMEGYTDGTFRADEISQRWTIAIVLARAKGLALDPAPTTATFADVATTDPYFKEVEAIYKAGYTQGCGTDPTTGKLKFCPTENLTRAALAVFMYNAYLKTPPTTTPPTTPTTPPTTTPTPTATPTATSTPTSTPTSTEQTTTTTTTTGTGTTGTTGTAKTGAEVPLAGGGALGLLFLVRYLVGKRIK